MYKGKQIFTGPRGGIFYFTDSNRKRYITGKLYEHQLQNKNQWKKPT